MEKVKVVSVTPDAEKTMAYIARVSNPAIQEKDNFSGFGGATNFEQTSNRSNKDLSKEEEFLLEDIINQENIPSTIDETIPDFE